MGKIQIFLLSPEEEYVCSLSFSFSAPLLDGSQATPLPDAFLGSPPLKDGFYRLTIIKEMEEITNALAWDSADGSAAGYGS